MHEAGNCSGKYKRVCTLRRYPQTNTADDGRRQLKFKIIKTYKGNHIGENGTAEGFYFCLKQRRRMTLDYLILDIGQAPQSIVQRPMSNCAMSKKQYT